MSKVTVGCIYPNGLVLHLGKAQVTLNGSNSSTVIGGHGLTEVDAEFWDAWLERNKGLSFVRNGKVFAHEKAKNTKAEAKEKAKEKSGLEPLDPSKAPVGIKAAE